MKPPIHQLVPARIRELHPYRPGQPIEEVERELNIRAVKMASNENPLGPSPKAMEAARAALEDANRYPDGSGYYLREKLAGRLGVERDRIILGNGSTELIEIVARTVLEPGDEGLTSAGSFPVYYLAIRAAGGELKQIPQRGYDTDLEAMAAAATARTKLVFLANPNNPTGRMYTAGEFEAFVARLPEHVLVVCDEAYKEYVERDDFPETLGRAGERQPGPPVLLLHTFSKVYGLAGLRMGYGIGPGELIAEMNKVRSPFNISNVALAAGLAALDDREHVRRSVESNRAGLAQLARGLEALGVKYVPSVTNFVLVELQCDAQPVADQLLQQGVIVRPMAWMGFPQAIRVSVGTTEEIEKFLAALGRVFSGPRGSRAGPRQTGARRSGGKGSGR